MGRDEIILVNPANARVNQRVLPTFPNLGLLTIGSNLQVDLKKNGKTAKVLYFDGALLGDQYLMEYISGNHSRILVIGFSSYTYNHESCISISAHAKKVDHNITTVIGNDHFSALWREVMQNREGIFDFGFFGNDVVSGFSNFCQDLLTSGLKEGNHYPGLVFRSRGPLSPMIERIHEDPGEYYALASVDYSLLDSLAPHSDLYLQEQKSVYSYMQEGGLNATVIDIARGCIKFAGRRNHLGIPLNACDFCGIIPGSKAVISLNSKRAWEIIGNAFKQGYNYQFITADELPLTFWPLLKSMAQNIPDWFRQLHPDERPKFMCYARADSFQEQYSDRIHTLISVLGIEHFFIGLDGLSEFSLSSMNKGLKNDMKERKKLLGHNLKAIEQIARMGGKLTAGIVITHLGITRKIMEENLVLLEYLVRKYRKIFIELDFELFSPVPGSLSYNYLLNPSYAAQRASELGLTVNIEYLDSIVSKYRGADLLDPEELVKDFILGCCPDISIEYAYEYLERIRRMVEQLGIVYDCSSIE